MVRFNWIRSRHQIGCVVGIGWWQSLKVDQPNVVVLFAAYSECSRIMVRLIFVEYMRYLKVVLLPDFQIKLVNCRSSAKLSRHQTMPNFITKTSNIGKFRMGRHLSVIKFKEAVNNPD